ALAHAGRDQRIAHRLGARRPLGMAERGAVLHEDFIEHVAEHAGRLHESDRALPPSRFGETLTPAATDRSRPPRVPTAMSRLTCALVITLTAACGALPPDRPTLTATDLAPVDVGDAHAFATAQNAFGLDIWRGLRAQHPGNLAISPASIA